MTDWELLQGYVREGSREAMCELMGRHIDMVRGTALRALGDGHLADDVTQAVFLVLMRRARSLTERVVLGGWLFKVTIFAAKDARRQRDRRRVHEREAAEMRSHDAVPVETHWAEVEPWLNEAMERLGTADRDVIALRYLEGKPVGEMARMLGVSENTLRQRLARALGRLREKLARRKLETTDVRLAEALGMAFVPGVGGELFKTMQAAVVRGTLPTTTSLQIAKGVMRMMRNLKMQMAAAMGAGILVVATGVAVLVAQTGGAGAAASQPVAAQVKSKIGPRDTPKGTVLAAYEAILSYDEEGLLSCFDNLPEAQAVTVRQTTRVMSAFKEVMGAVKDRYGAAAQAKLLPMDPTAVNPEEVEKSTEKIEGETATVDLGKSGPGMVQMVKVGKVWKISSATLQTLNARLATQLDEQVPAIKKLAADIKSGKYATFLEAQEAMGMVIGPVMARP